MQRKLKGLFGKAGPQKSATFDEPRQSERKVRSSIWKREDHTNGKHSSSSDSLPERGRTRSVAHIQQNTAPLQQNNAPLQTKITTLEKDSSSSSTAAGGITHPKVKRLSDTSMKDDVGHPGYRARNTSGPVSIRSTAKSLGGDLRLLPEASKAKHSEDVANRNIERSAAEHEALLQSDFSRHNSIEIESSKEKRLSVGRASLQRVNSSGKDSLKRMNSIGARSVTADVVEEEQSSPDLSDDGEFAKYHWTGGKAKATRMAARDEKTMNRRTRHKDINGQWVDDEGPHPEDYGPRLTKEDFAKLKAAELHSQSRAFNASTRSSSFDGAGEDTAEPHGWHTPNSQPLKPDVKMGSTEHVDEDVQWAEAVTHEHVNPVEHHIRQERIYRDIHNHDVYHRIQPILQTEILPPKHYVQDPISGELAEVPPEQVPDRWKDEANQRWSIGERKVETAAQFPPPQARLTEPKLVDEKKTITPEGVERIDSVIVHPSTLEDMSAYKGPVLPIEFIHHSEEQETGLRRKSLDRGIDNVPEVLPVTLKEITDSLPGAFVDGPMDEEAEAPAGTMASPTASVNNAVTV